MAQKVILAIDDNEKFVNSLKDMLQDEGYKVVALTDPEKTEEYISKYSPALLIIDVLMPKRSGFNIIEDFRAKGIYQDIPKIFLTCLDNEIEKMTAEAQGVNRYITKPFQPEKLIKLVMEMV